MSATSSTPATFTETGRRAQLVDAAIATVNEIGYHRASLAEIARRAGVAKSAILYYFASRESLLLAVIDHVFTGLDNALVTPVASEIGPVEQIRAYAEAYISHLDTHRAQITAGTEVILAHRTADGTPYYLTGAPEDSALLRYILEAGMRQGVFAPLPIPLAIGIVESHLSLATTSLQRDPAADLTPHRTDGIDFLLRGLRARTHEQGF